MNVFLYVPQGRPSFWTRFFIPGNDLLHEALHTPHTYYNAAVVVHVHADVHHVFILQYNADWEYKPVVYHRGRTIGVVW